MQLAGTSVPVSGDAKALPLAPLAAAGPPLAAAGVPDEQESPLPLALAGGARLGMRVWGCASQAGVGCRGHACA